MESMLGFRYPFTNGSSRVRDKGLGNPNRPRNVVIIETNKFGINMPIVSATKSIRRISWSGKVLGDGITPFGNTTLIDLCHFLLRPLPFLHECNIFSSIRGICSQQGLVELGFSIKRIGEKVLISLVSLMEVSSYAFLRTMSSCFTDVWSFSTFS